MDDWVSRSSLNRSADIGTCLQDQILLLDRWWGKVLDVTADPVTVQYARHVSDDLTVNGYLYSRRNPFHL